MSVPDDAGAPGTPCAVVPARLGRVARWARKQVIRPGYPVAQHLALVAGDGTSLHAVRLAGPPGAIASVVVVHGITNSSRTPPLHAFAHDLSTWAHVVVPDLRGHGASGGACTLGTAEPLDVAAAVLSAAATAPDVPVVLVGTSLGGIACLLAAASPAVRDEAGVAGVFAVSSPAFRERNLQATARLLGWCNTTPGRLFMRSLLRTRIDPGWRALDDRVHLGISGIAPAFTIVVHDPADRYFGADHAEALYAAAAEPKNLWWLPGTGHGVDLLTPAFADRVRSEVTARLR